MPWTSVFLPRLIDALYNPGFSLHTRSFITEPALLPDVFYSARRGLRYHLFTLSYTNIGSQLCWGQQKSRFVSLAASFYKCPGYFYVVLDSL